MSYHLTKCGPRWFNWWLNASITNYSLNQNWLTIIKTILLKFLPVLLWGKKWTNLWRQPSRLLLCLHRTQWIIYLILISARRNHIPFLSLYSHKGLAKPINFGEAKWPQIRSLTSSAINPLRMDHLPVYISISFLNNGTFQNYEVAEKYQRMMWNMKLVALFLTHIDWSEMRILLN